MASTSIDSHNLSPSPDRQCSLDRLKLLTHRLSLPKPASETGRYQSGTRQPVPGDHAVKKIRRM